MNRLCSVFLTGLFVCSANAELFISEYVEGSSNNKAIEIFNPGSSPVSLSNYSLKLFTNGSPTPSQSLSLSGTINSKQALVACHTSADATIQAIASFTSGSVINFNGNDAFALYNGSTIVDVIGQIGFDPGTQWGSGSTSTLNHTLRRKSSILTGDIVGSDAFNPSIEWVGFSQNTFDGLGSHTIDGDTIPPDSTSGGPFTIFHINDMHSRLTPHELNVPEEFDTTGFELVGGASRLTTKMLELKSADTNSLVLDAGDISEGNPLGDLRGNGGTIDFMCLLDSKLKALGGRGIDASVVGNHDVRYRQYLINMKNASFPFVSMNVCRAGTKTPYFQAYKIVHVNGQKVGILGYTNQKDQPGAETDSIIDVVKCAWTDSDTSTINIREYVDSLRNFHHCDVVIFLSHYGHTPTVASSADIPVPLIVDGTSTVVPEIIISGHWHTMTDKVWQPKTLNNKTFIAEAASYLEFIGEVNVDSLARFVSAQKHAIRASEIQPNSSVDSLISILIAEYNDSFPSQPLFDTIGYTAIDLTLDDDKWWSMNEYPWPGDNSAGNWIAESMKWKLNQLGKSCDLAMQSGGGIRRDIPAGPITYIQIHEMYPWDDDWMTRVSMSGAQIWKFLEDEGCGVSISENWKIWAQDGVIDSIKYNNIHVRETSSLFYNVAISRYMHDHPDGSNLGTLVEHTVESIREGAVDYAATFTSGNPYTGYGKRYHLDTDLAGIFDAVVTMVGDDESSPIYENGFVRLLSASPSTVAQRGKYVPESLVNANGSINKNHQFSECMHYRSYLGFPKGLLKNGTIIRLKAEGGFYRGNPQLIEQEGIVARDSALEIIGFDTTLAQPEYMSCINSFWNEQYENHYVKFYATRTSVNTVADRNGTTITLYQEGGYNTKTLPGNNGDLLEICGVNTQYWENKRFRVGKIIVATTAGFPPSSEVNPINPYIQTSSPITLTASVSDAVVNVVSFSSIADAQVVQGYPTSNYGTSISMYVQKSGGAFQEERAWVKFNANGVPSGKTIQSATIKMYPWAHSGAGFDASIHHSTIDSWSESSINWTNQPEFGTGLDTVSLSAEDIWYSWDVTSVVQSQFTSGDSVLSFVLQALSGSSSYTFDSKEYSSGALAPRLEIIYADSGVVTQVTSVQFFYRYSSDSTVYGSWTSAGIDNAAPFTHEFMCPQGFGHYEFYSIATDNDLNIESAPLYADTRVQYVRQNSAPVASNPLPTSGSYNVPLNTQLSVTVNDPELDSMTVKFYYRSETSSVLIDSVSNVSSGSIATVNFTGLQMSKQYTWFVTTSDGKLETQSSDFKFNTGNPPVQAPISSPLLFIILATLMISAGGYRILQRSKKA